MICSQTPAFLHQLASFRPTAQASRLSNRWSTIQPSPSEIQRSRLRVQWPAAPPHVKLPPAAPHLDRVQGLGRALAALAPLPVLLAAAFFARRRAPTTCMATLASAASPEPLEEAPRGSLTSYVTGAAGLSGYGSGTTAQQVARDFGANLKGKVAVVTGCSGGIGQETCLQLCSQGATVVMGCRDATKMHAAAEDIRRRVPSAVVHELELDLARQESIKTFVESFAALSLPCHLLINNAGVMACPRTLTVDGFEMQLGVNHLGHFALTNRMALHLRAGAPARVINLASNAHSLAYVPEGIRLDDLTGERDYTKWGAYGQSKLANVLHARELNKRLRRHGIAATAYSVHPGVIGTDLWRYSEWYLAPLLRLGVGLLGKSIPQGAATTVYCAAAPDLPPGYYADCNPDRPTHPSLLLDPLLSLKLWDKSVELTKTDLE